MKFKVGSAVTCRRDDFKAYFLRYIIRKPSGRIYCGLSRFTSDADPRDPFMPPFGSPFYIEDVESLVWVKPVELKFERFHVHACYSHGEMKCGMKTLTGCPKHRLTSCKCNPSSYKLITCWVHSRRNQWYVDLNYKCGKRNLHNAH